MYIPSATYRIQLHHEFTFKNLNDISTYLKNLGISTIYASPFLHSRPGSMHGYDGIDPEKIDPEIGTEEEFEILGNKLKELGIGWLQDIAPNHMAFHHHNRYLADIFEKGDRSRFYHFFDINWNDPDPDIQDKIMTPFLGRPIKEALSHNEIKIALDNEGFYIDYFENRYPLNIKSYEIILSQVKGNINDEYDAVSCTFERFMHLQEKITYFVESADIIDEEWQNFKFNLYSQYQNSPQIRSAIDKALKRINNDQASLHYLLEIQHYLLTYWQVTEKKINYRRFFTINDLICLDINNPEVFNRYHRFLKRLWDKELLHGLRIDHIDGLFNPGAYLQRLRNLFGDDLYVVVEKILEWEESMPLHWPVQGTTGYGFMSTISHLFTNWQNKKKLTQLYQNILNERIDYHQLVKEKKSFILHNRMGGELNNLFHQMQMLNLMPDSEMGIEPDRLKEALAIFLVMHPVYRIYPTQYPIHQKEVAILRTAYNEAVEWNPELKKELKYLFHLFTEPPVEDPLFAENKLYFLMRCQQFTGPLEAKGVEDTTFYLYNRLISHNEVGNSPDIFGISPQEFHERMIERQLTYPHALNASATHDTKRGEDMRLRMNVISELPELWQSELEKWKKINKNFIKFKEGKTSPEPNDEYFIYQTICGAFPMEGDIDDTFKERIKDYMLKVVREGKENSNWSSPNQIYEFGILEFINNILNPEHGFLNELKPFVKQISNYGIIYSLAQQLLKITAPGIPDIYQGCELWDLSLVDPDNRRPVDYELRNGFLEEIKSSGNQENLIRSLWAEKANGKIKFYTIYKALQERMNCPELFKYGKYIPANISGEHQQHATGFFRNHQNLWSLTVVPHHLASFIPDQDLPIAQAWKNTHLKLPRNAPFIWKNIFTEETFGFDEFINFKDIFASYPIVFLTGSTE